MDALTNQWKVQVSGAARDLDYLLKETGTEPKRVERASVESGYLYVSDSFARATKPEDVRDLAREELAVLSGILRVARGSRTSLKAGAVYKANSNGGMDAFLFVEDGIYATTFGEPTLIVRDAAGNVIPRPKGISRAIKLGRLAETDAAVAKVMRLLDAPDAGTWVGLYRIHEVVEGDVGGEHQLQKRGWGLAADLKRFKHSANSPAVSGDGSRHGREPHHVPKNPMSLDVAESYLNFVVQSWLASKGG